MVYIYWLSMYSIPATTSTVVAWLTRQYPLGTMAWQHVILCCYDSFRCEPGFIGSRCQDVQEASSNANRANEDQAVVGGENMFGTDLVSPKV